jgi:hypothetical protein
MKLAAIWIADVTDYEEWNYCETGIKWDQRGFRGTKPVERPGFSGF